MLRIVIVFLAASWSSFLFSQTKSDTTETIRIICYEKYDSLNAPIYILLIDDKEIILDDATLRVEPKHIRTAKVSKDEEDLIKYNTEVGIVRIYPKKRFMKLFREEYSEEIKNGT